MSQLTISQVQNAANAMAVSALQDLAGHPNILARELRGWMEDNSPDTETTRPELQEAVLNYLAFAFGRPFGTDKHRVALELAQERERS